MPSITSACSTSKAAESRETTPRPLDGFARLRHTVIPRRCMRWGIAIFTGVESPWTRRRDFALALAAAKIRVVEAQYSVGVCYERGQGVPADPKKAFRWY